MGEEQGLQDASPGAEQKRVFRGVLWAIGDGTSMVSAR